MAAQQAYYQQQMAMAQKGPLQPGQTIKLTQYTVTVERYLSQGGFAHVYLVRTSTPVMGTTQHVLKRMAVADVATLAEVKKEVDIMRLLRGHPNIVHLLDSASRPLPNGQHEVYILMEFCQGGGIIDMMNRRLRERLTEKDILQIFVDVCEAVACMHSLQPALLHRDLKVENILQASDTSFKLCDFGSAAPSKPKPPSTMEEIKLLEADLNRSTTLQYRAPEMVDVYLRRPIDEKSDVWALGVLLYKLCYYTTPFEAHGPLAILHVQYSIPGYPVYSKELNALIGCMLRELGVQRPSVFEILNVVHRMRGTKSAFNYTRPQIPAQIQSPPQPSQDQLIQVARNGAQPQAPSAREKQLREQKEALDAMGMRRGRPDASPSPVPPHSSSHAQHPSSHAQHHPPSHAQQASSPLPSRQPLPPLTRSRPSKSGSEKASRSRQQTHEASASPRKSVPSTPRGATPTTPRVAPSTPSTPRASKASAVPIQTQTQTQTPTQSHSHSQIQSQSQSQAQAQSQSQTHAQTPKTPSTPSAQRISTNVPGRTGPVSPRKSSASGTTAPLVPASPRKSTGKQPPVGGVKLPGVGGATAAVGRSAGTGGGGSGGVKQTTTGVKQTTTGVKQTTTGGGIKPIGTGSGLKPTGTGSAGLKAMGTGTGAGAGAGAGAGSGMKPMGTGSAVKPTGTGSGMRPTVTGSGLRPTGTGSGLRPIGTGANGVKGLNTGDALRSPTTTDFFNDPSWKHVDSPEKEKDIWGGEGVSSLQAAKFDGFADSFDAPTGKARPLSQLGMNPAGGSGGGHHQTSSHSHHQPTSTHSHHQQTTTHLASSNSLSPPSLQQPKSRTSAARDAFEGLGIPSAPSPALSLRELAARSPNPSPGIPVHNGHGVSPVPFTRSPHPLATGATTGTGTLTTHATAGSATSGTKGGTGAKASAMALSAEERFPSIEDLDAAGVWGPASTAATTTAAASAGGATTQQPPKLPPRPRETAQSHMTGPNSFGLKAPVQASGARSQQVTGTAMKDSERGGASAGGAGGAGIVGGRALPVPPGQVPGPGLLRKTSGGVKRTGSMESGRESSRREDMSVRRGEDTPTRRGEDTPTRAGSPAKPRPTSIIQTTPKPTAKPPRTQSQTVRPDWLTGDFLEAAAAMGISVPDSPSKRSSAILSSGGAGTRYQAPLKSPTHSSTPLKSPVHTTVPLKSPVHTTAPLKTSAEKLGRTAAAASGRATPDRLSDLLGNSGRQTSMTESSNDEGPEDPVSHYGRSKLERRGAVTRSSPERKSRSSTMDVPITTVPSGGSSAHRRQPSEQPSKPARTPSTTSTASHPPTSGNRHRRPQSMFIQPGSATLSPPTDANAPTKRSVRRGSISDMVSKYEAMAVEEPGTPAPAPGVQQRPSIAPKPVGLRAPSSKVERERERAKSPEPAPRSPSRAEATRPRSPSRGERERPRSPSRTERERPRSPSRAEQELPSTTASTSVFNRENRVRQSPTEMMREVPIQDGNARGGRPPSPTKLTHPVVQPQPARAAGSRGLHTLTPQHTKEEAPPVRAPSPPASPDKPYQGVGRLIDQWQKKAGAEPARPLGPRVGRR
ncbi:Serine/threonine-protein kinase [Rhizoctonia solani]|uniref:non-specific serine/threonine protein kinase n=1 Tax=Rhizoctonia solani TaxID=456999 RepID=A0A8H8P0L4_9AGAM|nr:Serine/threonine-protein kinase [Rhizoctonia solani]QRW22353.1 Serine/threonine-protein kinase [Rhizoctonia solani]